MSPEASRFYGIVVYFNANDHPPPHLHARHGEHRISVDIRTMDVIQGDFPRSSLRILRDWMQANHDILQQAWDLARKGVFVRIPPHRR